MLPLYKQTSSFRVAAENLMFTIAKAGASTISDGLGIAISFYDAVKSFISDANFNATTTVDNVQITYQTTQMQSIDYMYRKNQKMTILKFYLL